MPKLNMTRAAKAAGIARGTLYKHIKEGRVTCEQNEKGEKVIDTAELLRVYGELRHPDTSSEQTEERANERHETPESVLLREQITLLQKQVEDLRQDKQTSQKREEDLLTIIKQQQALLPPPQQPKKAGLWARVLGG